MSAFDPKRTLALCLLSTVADVSYISATATRLSFPVPLWSDGRGLTFLDQCKVKARGVLHAAEHYELESLRARSAAERAATVSERIRHLEIAQRYAKLASGERKRSNVYGFNLNRR
jgi:hypothetical protein